MELPDDRDRESSEKDVPDPRKSELVGLCFRD